MTEQEKIYREDPSLNYSLLSKLDQDPRRVIGEDQVTKYQTFGSVVDKLLFERSDFFNDFYIVDFKYPSDTIKKIVDRIYEMGYWGEDTIVQAAKEFSYGNGKYKDDRIISDITKKGKEYYDKLVETEGYNLISQEEYQEATAMVDMLKYHEFTEEILNIKSNETYEVFAQYPLFATINDIKFKGLLDYLIVDHSFKLIFPYDLKTTSSNNFAGDVYKYKYYLQAALYSDLVAANYPDYKVDNFTFIVARRGNMNNPLKYICTQKDLQMGRIGGINPNTGKRVKGYRRLAEEYYWHLEHDKWDDPKEVYDNNGTVELDLFSDKHLKSA